LNNKRRLYQWYGSIQKQFKPLVNGRNQIRQMSV